MNFSQQVYQLVKKIPPGKVTTYGRIAVQLGKPGAARAVGNALHHNPDPKTIPCHRVVNSKGKLAKNFGGGGEGGHRRRLLAEGVKFKDVSTVDKYPPSHVILEKMLKKKAANRLFPTLVWLVVVSVLHWNWQLSAGSQAPGLISLWLGAFLGTYLLDLDHLLYLLIIKPQEATSLRVSQLFKQKQIREGLGVAAATQEERVRLPFHSALFQPVLYVLCFFVLTSTNSLFGAGLVMAMALHLLVQEVSGLLQGREEHLRRWLFWPIKGEVSFRAQKYFVIIMVMVFLGLNLFLI